MAAAMNDEQFEEFLGQARRANTPEKQTAVLAIVDHHAGIVHRADEKGFRLLDYASARGYMNLMRGVIDRGAVVNAKNTGGVDALMSAAFNGRIPAATLLLDHGADLNARDNDGQNALMFAARNDKLDCAVFLLNRGVDLLAVDNNGKTALDLYGIIGLSDEVVKEQRRKVLREAYANAEVVRLKKSLCFVAPLASMPPCSSPKSSQTWSSKQRAASASLPTKTSWPPAPNAWTSC